MSAPAARAERDLPLGLALSPQGVLHLLTETEGEPLPHPIAERLLAAFALSPAQGLLHLGTVELGTELPASLAFGRELTRRFFTRLSAVPDLEAQRAAISVPALPAELEALIAAAPPMTGAEYLSVDALGACWSALEALVQQGLRAHPGSAEDYLHALSPLWNLVGRVHFHLAENKGNEHAPFAFMATYATRLSEKARVQHAPLGKAIEEHAGARNKDALLKLLQPVQRAAEHSAFLAGLVARGEIFHPLAWTPTEAYAFLQDIPAFEAGGVVVRVPDWWHARRATRPTVQVSVGKRAPSQVGADALLDFDIRLTLDGEALSPAEWKQIQQSTRGLVLIKGKWVEVDPDKLKEMLAHWKEVQKKSAHEGLSFLEGMRLLSGAPIDAQSALQASLSTSEWVKVSAGDWLAGLLADLQHPQGSREADPGKALQGTLRPYQRAGVAWLWLLSRLGLGACLADDMGLGKTIQVLSLLLLLKKKAEPGPHLLVLPASLLGNWSAEITRFAPSLRFFVAHPSALSAEALAARPADLAEHDVVLTSYGTLLRVPWLSEQAWGLVALDEAQAIKNPGARQSRAVKALKSRTRLALTGTPVENRLGDLWSIFDFLCPGLLGSAKAFQGFSKKLGADPVRGYAPLRALTRPYILRRMKSDKSIIADLPDKTELVAYCPLSKVQAVLYAQAVKDLARTLDDDKAEGIQRKGLILASLLRFKQICNHPSQWLGDGVYAPGDSGKLARLRELCEPIAARQEKALIFTQFREMTAPLAAFLAEVFGRPGLVLHGDTKVKDRQSLVASFQRDDGPPFFVLSLKAGGTGLNLTAASHVIHFDRWWNPAVEGQATDRAYRIGQKKNVLVHKFVCKGTIEERIDALIASKQSLSQEILGAGGGEGWLTELSSDELLRMVSLDLRSALDER
jgi:non-specific serine/threonine protein kinase